MVRPTMPFGEEGITAGVVAGVEVEGMVAAGSVATRTAHLN
jgi:hypothetical protein